MAPVVVLNGGSSSGKTSIARCLQRLLGPTWLILGVDDLVRALPGGDEVDELIRSHRDGGAPLPSDSSVNFGEDGSVSVTEDFRRAERSWYAGLAPSAPAGPGSSSTKCSWVAGRRRSGWRQLCPAWQWCGWEFGAIPALPRPASVFDPIGCLGWPACKPSGYTTASSTTSSWTPLPPAQPTAQAWSSRISRSKADDAPAARRVNARSDPSAARPSAPLRPRPVPWLPRRSGGQRRARPR